MVRCCLPVLVLLSFDLCMAMRICSYLLMQIILVGIMTLFPARGGNACCETCHLLWLLIRFNGVVVLHGSRHLSGDTDLPWTESNKISHAVDPSGGHFTENLLTWYLDRALECVLLQRIFLLALPVCLYLSILK